MFGSHIHFTPSGAGWSETQAISGVRPSVWRTSRVAGETGWLISTWVGLSFGHVASQDLEVLALQVDQLPDLLLTHLDNRDLGAEAEPASVAPAGLERPLDEGVEPAVEDPPLVGHELQHQEPAVPSPGLPAIAFHAAKNTRTGLK